MSVLNVNRTCDDITNDSIDDEVLCDVVELENNEKLLAGYYNILFAHPESLLSSRFGRSLSGAYEPGGAKGAKAPQL